LVFEIRKTLQPGLKNS